MMTAMAELPSTWPKGIKTHEEVLAERFASDPEFAVEWERLALARLVAVQLIRYRADRGLSQRGLAERLGVSQPRVVELELGEKNPQIETLVRSRQPRASSSRSTSRRSATSRSWSARP
jgi:DNA-binding XRE family transcriptional regulator